MNIVTVDLDDTLISTHKNYVNSKNDYVEYMHNKFGFDKNRVKNLLEDIDSDLFEPMGLSKKRYPTAFIRTAEQLLSDKKNINLDEEKNKAQNFGLKTYKTKEEYKQDGFMNNAETMLDILVNRFDRVHLLTVGVPSVQEPKIKVLELSNWFDEFHIEELGGKSDAIQELRNEYNADSITHIGNSEKSDIQAALEANAQAVYLPNNEWMGKSDINYRTVDDVHVFDSISEYITHLK